MWSLLPFATCIKYLHATQVLQCCDGKRCSSMKPQPPMAHAAPPLAGGEKIFFSFEVSGVFVSIWTGFAINYCIY